MEIETEMKDRWDSREEMGICEIGGGGGKCKVEIYSKRYSKTNDIPSIVLSPDFETSYTNTRKKSAY